MSLPADEMTYKVEEQCRATEGKLLVVHQPQYCIIRLQNLSTTGS